MRRHPALEQLSRDHHRALVVAQELKRANESTAVRARERFLSYWDSEGFEHFRQEEEILLPACARFLDPDQPLVARVLTEHECIRHLARKIATAERLSLDVLHELGSQLERHVRREERELFPVIEQAMPDTELRCLISQLSASAQNA